MDILYMYINSFIILLYICGFSATLLHIGRKKVTFQNAQQVCEDYFNEKLAKPEEIKSYQILDKTTKDIKFWIPVKRNISDYWWTINGNFYSKYHYIFQNILH